jgi:hypothetical protein
MMAMTTSSSIRVKPRGRPAWFAERTAGREAGHDNELDVALILVR